MESIAKKVQSIKFHPPLNGLCAQCLEPGVKFDEEHECSKRSTRVRISFIGNSKLVLMFTEKAKKTKIWWENLRKMSWKRFRT